MHARTRRATRHKQNTAGPRRHAYVTTRSEITLPHYTWHGVKGHWRSLKLVPFESFGTVSYSPSIVTMAVSVAVCEIFSVKEWCDLENRVRVRSRSLEVAPFDRLHTSSYSPSMTTTLGWYTSELSFQQILPTLILLLPWTAFTITGPDQTYHASWFIFSSFFFNFLFASCGGLSWLHVSFSLHIKYTLLHRIV